MNGSENETQHTVAAKGRAKVDKSRKKDREKTDVSVGVQVSFFLIDPKRMINCGQQQLETSRQKKRVLK